MRLWIYLPLTSVIYLLWYVSGIKAVAVSKTTKGDKMTKSYTVRCNARSRHFWSCHDFWQAFKVSESVNSLFCVCVYALPNLQQPGTSIKGPGCLLSKLSLFQQMVTQQRADRSVWAGDSVSGWTGFSSARCGCQHGSSSRTVQIST